MYNNKRILAFIPARANSKRVINKNKRLLAGKPLFLHSVEVAKNNKFIDDVLVSTDDHEIKELSIKSGCLNTSLRPDYLSGDNARIVDSILYEVSTNLLNYDAVILLQPTFPFRSNELLNNSIIEYFKNEESLITVEKINIFPGFIRKIDKKGILEKITNLSGDTRSQDFNDYYKIVGNVYINNLKKIKKETILNENKYPFEIEGEFCLDIDTEEDFKKATDIYDVNKKQ